MDMALVEERKEGKRLDCRIHIPCTSEWCKPGFKEEECGQLGCFHLAESVRPGPSGRSTMSRCRVDVITVEPYWSGVQGHAAVVAMRGRRTSDLNHRGLASSLQEERRWSQQEEQARASGGGPEAEHRLGLRMRTT
jgi:hypothetical protein